MIQEKAYIQDLIIALQGGRTAEERAGAARGLGHIGGGDAIVALCQSMKEGKTAEERAAAAESLGLALANSHP